MGKDKETLKLAIKDELLGRMGNGDVGGSMTLSAKWLYEDFLPSLSGKEEAALEEGIAEMIHDGIIVRTDDHRPTYRLTRKGRELLCR
jgi:DNA-binding HxlR family transcriptional regulator